MTCRLALASYDAQIFLCFHAGQWKWRCFGVAAASLSKLPVSQDGAI